MAEVLKETGVPTHISLSSNPSPILANIVTFINTLHSTRSRYEHRDGVTHKGKFALFDVLPDERLKICLRVDEKYMDLMFPPSSPNPAHASSNFPPEDPSPNSTSHSLSSSSSSLDSLVPTDGSISSSPSTSPSSVLSDSDLDSDSGMEKTSMERERMTHLECEVTDNCGERRLGLVLQKEGLRGWRGTWVELEDTPLYDDDSGALYPSTSSYPNPPKNHLPPVHSSKIRVTNCISPRHSRIPSAYSSSSPSPSPPSPSSHPPSNASIELYPISQSSHHVFKITPSLYTFPHPIPPAQYYPPHFPKPAPLPHIPPISLNPCVTKSTHSTRSTPSNPHHATPRIRLLCDTQYLHRLATHNSTREVFSKNSRTRNITYRSKPIPAPASYTTDFPTPHSCALPNRQPHVCDSAYPNSYIDSRLIRRVLSSPPLRVISHGTGDSRVTELHESKIISVCWEGRERSSLGS